MKTLKEKNILKVILIIMILSLNSFAAFAAEDDVIDLHGTNPNPPIPTITLDIINY